MYEAAALDGASRWRQFWSITVPLVRRSMAFLVVVQTLAVFQMFAEPFVVTEGGPYGSTTTAGLYLYEHITASDLGTGAANSFLLVLLVFGLSLGAVRLLRAERRGVMNPTRPASSQYVLLTLLALAFLYPIWWAISSSFKPAAEIITSPLSIGAPTLDNYRAMFADVPIGTGFANTALVLAVKGAMTMFFCPLAGYAFAKYAFPGKDLLFGVVLLTLMLPTLVLIIPLLLEMSALGWVNTYQALILPGSIDAFSIFWMRQTIAAIPDELIDAGRVDGAGEFGIFAKVVLPVIRPGMAALAVLTTMNVYNDFVWPVVAVNEPRTRHSRWCWPRWRRTSPATGSAPTSPPSGASCWPPAASPCCRSW